MSDQTAVPPVPPEVTPTPAVPLGYSTAAPAKPPVSGFWKAGGVVIILNVVLNLMFGILLMNRADAISGRRADNSVFWAILAGQLIVGLIVGAGLMNGQVWAKWVAWTVAAIAAVLLVFVGTGIRSPEGGGAIVYYVMAAVVLLGWLLLLDTGGKFAVNMTGAVLVALPCFFSLLRIISLASMPTN